MQGSHPWLSSITSARGHADTSPVISLRFGASWVNYGSSRRRDSAGTGLCGFYHPGGRALVLAALINPSHKIPTIVDGDFVLWESRAIMRYLVTMFGSDDNSLYPKDPQKRAVVDQLLDHDLGIFYRTMLEDIMMPLRQKTETTKEQDEKVTKAFEWLDSQVKDKKFLTGDNLTIADFSVVVGCVAIVVAKEDVSKYTHAMAWLERMKELPYYKEINQPFFDIIEKMKQDKKA